ncbi:uncharacterized protein FIESC28_00995 [Fusarium coffeatum]|uniref:Uncharacterized protein n=1 Tax=Fusarium coffeatum TaxID=231269 RepID=A0A366SB82_9HYPO|nr:uncharacterized protein FIESC28_00995 [Fusarium coffeatum]RBR26212.1 hypothetical protein FIESC28_00995 [Fusarium coffeatum]
MVATDYYSLIDEGVDSVPPDWFDKQRGRLKSKNEALRGYLYTEIDVLKSFHDGELGYGEAAHAITRPDSDSPVPKLDTYEDEIHVICHLWRLLKDALVEWPSTRTPGVIKLCLAISQVPDKIHNGEATDDDYQPLTWDDLPYFGMVWTDAHWMLPKNILETQKYMDIAGRRQARDVYVKQQNVEAQLVMAEILLWRTACWAITYALEREDGKEEDYGQMKGDESESAEMEVKEKGLLDEKDFEIPAAACWIEHACKKLYSRLVQDEPRKEPRDWELWDGMRQHQFSQSLDRWDYWMDRFRVAARDFSDDYTRERARAALQTMERIKRDAIETRD